MRAARNFLFSSVKFEIKKIIGERYDSDAMGAPKRKSMLPRVYTRGSRKGCAYNLSRITTKLCSRATGYQYPPEQFGESNRERKRRDNLSIRRDGAILSTAPLLGEREAVTEGLQL